MSLKKQGPQGADSRALFGGARMWRLFITAMMLAGCLILVGCRGPSKEDQAKQDEQGKKTNDAAMQRMMQEQGRPGAMPGAQGK